MTHLAWGAGSPPGYGFYPWATTGSSASMRNFEEVFCGPVESNAGVMALSYVWSPDGADPSPVDDAELEYLYFWISNNSSGLLTVSATFDGVPAQNTLVMRLTSKGGGSTGSATWGQGTTDGTEPPPPTAKTIGWGAPAGINNTPGNSGYAVTNEGTGDAFSQTFAGGVVGDFAIASYVCEWEPVIPGMPSEVSFTQSYGGFQIGLGTSLRPGGTFRITGIVDGLAAASKCILVVAGSDWAASVYGGVAWSTTSDQPGFWTLFIGTEET